MWFCWYFSGGCFNIFTGEIFAWANCPILFKLFIYLLLLCCMYMFKCLARHVAQIYNLQMFPPTCSPHTFSNVMFSYLGVHKLSVWHSLSGWFSLLLRMNCFWVRFLLRGFKVTYCLQRHMENKVFSSVLWMNTSWFETGSRESIPWTFYFTLFCCVWWSGNHLIFC